MCVTAPCCSNRSFTAKYLVLKSENVQFREIKPTEFTSKVGKVVLFENIDFYFEVRNGKHNFYYTIFKCLAPCDIFVAKN